MKIITTIQEMKGVVRELKAQGKTIGFVPTMGYLHEGHVSLVRRSIEKSEVTVVSIFVNPAQFGPREDFKEYPRDIDRDTRILEAEGADYVFCPHQDEIYPHGYKTYVEVHDLQNKLCGRSRPTHFRGVCTVVLKLFHIVSPDLAFFGQKDAQQAIILKRMVKDLDLEVEIEVLPIVRDSDGLALSSRNKYLKREERRAALVLPESLQKAKELIRGGEKRAPFIIGEMVKMIAEEPLARIDYVEIVDVEELSPVETLEKEVLIALAVYVGRTRLIDNMAVEIIGTQVRIKE